MNAEDARKAYWRKNLTYVGVLLAIWFTVSYGFSILLVDWLDRIRIPGTGFKLGFWFAQQGSMIVFVLLIFVYTRLMNRLDREYKFSEDDATPRSDCRLFRGAGMR